MKITCNYVKITLGDLMNFVFKPSENIKEKIIDYYKDLTSEKKPPYSLFQAMEADTTITMYESGKVMFQGISADVDANMWAEMEMKFNNRKIDFNKKKKEKEKTKQDDDEKYGYLKHVSTIGSDEVGTGDYFGPIVVTASFVSKENIPFVRDLKISDSKSYNDEDILKLAPTLMTKIPYVTFMLSNKEYNNMENSNLNHIKAVLHNKVLYKLINDNNLHSERKIVDQFVNRNKYYEYLKDVPNKVEKIFFLTKAEDKVYSVAVASIISRYLFLKEMDKLSKLVGETIPLGAGHKVDEFGKKIVIKHGKDILFDISKYNFKNTKKILED